jgi:hypothetical protein
LASRKKYDPKKESMDFKKKFDIVQKLWNVFSLYVLIWIRNPVLNNMHTYT